MDLKKEIKLSDLVPKRKPKEPNPEADEAPKKRKKPKKPKTPLLKKDLSFKRKPKAKREPVEEDEQPKKKRSKRAPRDGARTKRAKKLVGLKIGGSQLAAARIVNNGSPELVQVAREKLDHGLVVGGELREPELLARTIIVSGLPAAFRERLSTPEICASLEKPLRPAALLEALARCAGQRKNEEGR